ncbi:hypothetical protein UFOVP1516_30 [uncultured Caudovirales phage]|uniref:Uncharacterized protein n=1 Tax=uncultured Caudovirales phage TaxID=2100421 RepID=A0A6J7XFZ7_9CAUD|nr:hypothetical protein UFOVP887_14 [uncultured Caudovirales phage]CAB5226804.1 hypothetical protein UFOVP1516_30 [uncultured Caudovirales phage]
MKYKEYLLKLVALSHTEKMKLEELRLFYYANLVADLEELDPTIPQLKERLTELGVPFCQQH